MWEITKQFKFEAAHQLPHLPDTHKCRNLHGHSYRFDVLCRGDLDERGFVIDYAEIKDAAQRIVDVLDHAFIAGEIDTLHHDLARRSSRYVVLPIPCTSAEHLARWIYDELKRDLDSLHQIVFYETASTSVKYPC